MGAKVKWREDRSAWYLFVYANGTQAAKKYGPKLSDKRRAERDAREIDKAEAQGRLGLEKREQAVPFEGFAKDYCTSMGGCRSRVQRGAALPAESGRAADRH